MIKYTINLEEKQIKAMEKLAYHDFCATAIIFREAIDQYIARRKEDLENEQPID